MARHVDKSSTGKKKTYETMESDSLDSQGFTTVTCTSGEPCKGQNQQQGGMHELGHVLQRLNSEYLEQIESKLSTSVYLQDIQRDSYYSPSSPESGYHTSTFYMEPSSPACSMVSTCSSRGPVIKPESHDHEELDELYDDDDRRSEISFGGYSTSSPATPASLLSPRCGNSIPSPAPLLSRQSVLSPLCGNSAPMASPSTGSILSPCSIPSVLSPIYENSITSPATPNVLSPLCVNPISSPATPMPSALSPLCRSSMSGPATPVTSDATPTVCTTHEDSKLTQEEALEIITDVIDEDQSRTENILSEPEIRQYDFTPDESFLDLDVDENISEGEYYFFHS